MLSGCGEGRRPDALEMIGQNGIIGQTLGQYRIIERLSLFTVRLVRVIEKDVAIGWGKRMDPGPHKVMVIEADDSRRDHVAKILTEAAYQVSNPARDAGC